MGLLMWMGAVGMKYRVMGMKYRVVGFRNSFIYKLLFIIVILDP
jgi:hypothetical protein